MAAETKNPDCCAYEYARLYVRGYAARTGVLVWEHVEAAYASWNGGTIIDVSPVIVGPPGNAVVYVATHYGFVFALSIADGSSLWPAPLGDDGSVRQFYRLGTTTAPILTPSGALITINQAPLNQVRAWGNASLPPYVDLNRSLLSCAPLTTSPAGPRTRLATGTSIVVGLLVAWLVTGA